MDGFFVHARRRCSELHDYGDENVGVMHRWAAEINIPQVL